MKLTKEQRTKNKERANRGAAVIAYYSDGVMDTNLRDLLADLLHACRADCLDFDDALSMARRHFAAERKGAK